MTKSLYRMREKLVLIEKNNPGGVRSRVKNGAYKYV
nr:MAG TPA: hypothetical protein [Caudoviricetes sp.]